MKKNAQSARPPRLSAEALYRICDPAVLPFSTTAELPDPGIGVGQARAVAALDFGARIRSDGFNVFVLGPPGSDRHAVVEDLLGSGIPAGRPAVDWCYVNGFDDERKPVALSLPAGRARELRRDMARLIEDLREAIPAAFASEQYRSALTQIDRELESCSAPAMDKLPRQEQRRDRIRQLDRQVVELAAGRLVDQLKSEYRGLAEVVAFFDAVREDVAANAKSFVSNDSPRAPWPVSRVDAVLGRYEVNVVVDRPGGGPPPVVYEQHPSLRNLLGRIEHVAQFGALVTHFRMIRAGALHRANGGFLILDADRLLSEPLAWSALKRALFAKKIRMESASELPSPISTVSLEPQPIPLDLKVVLIGERVIYYLLCELDPDFADLFKVAADFESRIDRTEENSRLYAQLIGAIARRRALLPLSAAAVARVIEHSSRLAGDAEKLTTRVRDISDLVSEASYRAAEEASAVVEPMHVERTIDAQIHRVDRMRSEFQEEISRRDLLIDTTGAKVGQVNGLTVFGLGNFNFGQPARITANVRIGDGEVIDIEREIELGEAIHSKGVLILSAYLGSRYATDIPLSVTASLVFEQSYGGIEGDSASVAETCALLSALSELPLEQSLAVTGSVNQHGEVQVIGGVNEKIEGFFDTCARRGLSGRQGVLIPKDNVKHLMLRRDVVEAVRAKRFHVYSIATIDDAISLLTGVAAGQRTTRGTFPRGTVNYRVEHRLRDFAEKREEVSQQILGKARALSKKPKHKK